MCIKRESIGFTLKEDHAFKRVLGDEENKEILSDFLSCVLDLDKEEIAGLELLDKELKKDRMEEKTAILDIQVRLKSGDLIDVEIQRVWNRLFPERSFAYLAKMYISSLKAGESFSRANRCIGINIIERGFNLTDRIHSKASFRFEGSEDVLVKSVEMHVLNLEKVKGLPILKARTREEHEINWLKMIDAENEEVRDMLAETSPVFKLLNERIEDITRSPEEELLFDARMKMRSDILGEMELNYAEGLERGIEKGLERGIEKGLERGRAEGVAKGRAEGRAEGMAKGRTEGIWAMARNMKSKSFDASLIAEITGLSQEEIEKL